MNESESILGKTITHVRSEDGVVYLHLNHDEIVVAFCPILVGTHPAIRVGSVNLEATTLQ